MIHVVECRKGNFEIEADYYTVEETGRVTFTTRKEVLKSEENAATIIVKDIATFKYWENVYCKDDGVKFIPHNKAPAARSLGQGGGAASRRAVPKLKPQERSEKRPYE